MAERVFEDISKELNNLKKATEGVSDDVEEMSGAFDKLSTMGEVSSKTLNLMRVKMKQYQDSITSNANIMGLTTAQQEKFNNETADAGNMLNALQLQLESTGNITEGAFGQMQTSIMGLQSGVSTFTGEMTKSANALEKEKKEVGATGMGALAKTLEESQEKLVDRFEESFSQGGIINSGFSALGQQVDKVAPEITSILKWLGGTWAFQWAKNAMLPYKHRLKEWWINKKIQRAQVKFFKRGGLTEDAYFDGQDRVLKWFGKGDGLFAKMARSFQETREKTLGFEDWEKLGLSKGATEDAQKVREALLERQGELLRDAEIIPQQLKEVNKTLFEQRSQLEKWTRTGQVEGKNLKQSNKIMQDMQRSIEENVGIQKELKTKQERGELDTGSTEGWENALKVLTDEGRINATTLEDMIKGTTKSIEDNLSGSPPYLEDIRNTLAEQTPLLEKTAEPSPAEGKIGAAFGAMKGKLSGMMSGVVGFFAGLGTALKSLPGKVFKILHGVGRGIAGLFKALGSIDPYSLAIGLAAITGLSINMILLAAALKIAGPAIVSIMGAIGRVMSVVFEGMAKVIEVYGKVVIAILEKVKIVIQAVGEVVVKYFAGLAKVFRTIGRIITSVFKGLVNVFDAVGRIIKTVGNVIIGIGEVIIKFMNAFVDNLIRLTEIPFGKFLKLAAAFVVLGGALAIFGTLGTIAVTPLLALGVATVGLAALMSQIGDPDKLRLLALGFTNLAGAIIQFGLSSLALVPALTIFKAISKIPFINKLLSNEEARIKQQSQNRTGTFTADTLVIGNMQQTGSQRMLGLNNIMEGLFGGEEPMGKSENMMLNSNVTNVNNNPTEVFVNKTAVDTNYIESMKGLRQVYA
jgi:hypothetical protein